MAWLTPRSLSATLGHDFSNITQPRAPRLDNNLSGKSGIPPWQNPQEGLHGGPPAAVECASTVAGVTATTAPSRHAPVPAGSRDPGVNMGDFSSDRLFVVGRLSWNLFEAESVGLLVVPSRQIRNTRRTVLCLCVAMAMINLQTGDPWPRVDLSELVKCRTFVASVVIRGAIFGGVFLSHNRLNCC
ncbi:hypothetical protein Bbelb_336340 [Branchiostoma belcheri]|nr:hypothetical protein Bbelb_336340 [Branchiostoma belcheri]